MFQLLASIKSWVFVSPKVLAYRFATKRPFSYSNRHLCFCCPRKQSVFESRLDSAAMLAILVLMVLTITNAGATVPIRATAKTGGTTTTSSSALTTNLARNCANSQV